MERNKRDNKGFWLVVFVLNIVIISMYFMLTGDAESHVGIPTAVPAAPLNRSNRNSILENGLPQNEKAGEDAEDTPSVEERIEKIAMMRIETAKICDEILERTEKGERQ